MSKGKELHEHYWFYPHAIWQGRRASEIAVMRYCQCGAKEMAFTNNWRAIPATHVDAIQMAKAEIRDMRRRAQ